MWKIRASTLIRQTLRAELCVIYPLLALWNKFLLFHWNLKEGTKNNSSLGISRLDFSRTQSELIESAHILMWICKTHMHTLPDDDTEGVFWGKYWSSYFLSVYFEQRYFEAVSHVFLLCPSLWDEGKEIGVGTACFPRVCSVYFSGVV